MNIISNAAWNIITVELTSSSARPLDKEHNKLIKDRSTESGYRFATKTKPPPLKGFITWCLKDWLVKSEDTIEVTAEYQMRNNERPRLARRLIFIREGNRWLFDQVKDISNSLLED
jgi:tricorn protease-like protein